MHTFFENNAPSQYSKQYIHMRAQFCYRGQSNIGSPCGVVISINNVGAGREIE